MSLLQISKLDVNYYLFFFKNTKSGICYVAKDILRTIGLVLVFHSHICFVMLPFVMFWASCPFFRFRVGIDTVFSLLLVADTLCLVILLYK